MTQPVEPPALFQPTFFADLGESDFFCGLDTDNAKRYAQSTGTTLERRGQIAQTALEMVLQGISQRRTAEALSIGRNTIRALVARWDANGKLEPLKKRLSAKLGHAVEVGIEAWTDALESGLVKPETIPVAVGIFSDKRALLDGEPTVRIEAGKREPTVEDVRAMIASLPSANPVTPPAEVVDYPKDYAPDAASQVVDNKDIPHESK